MTASALPITDSELREVVVDELELLSGPDFDAVTGSALRRHLPAVKAVAERAGIGYSHILRHLSQRWDIEYISLRASDVVHSALALIPEIHARRCGAVAMTVVDGCLHVAFKNPREAQTVAEIQRLARMPIQAFLAEEADIERALLLYRPGLQELFQLAGSGQLPITVPRAGRPEPQPAELATQLFAYAACAEASDIHIEPFKDETIVRFRIDGALQETLLLTPALSLPLVSRIKVLGQMRVDEKRAPQDGRIQVDLHGVSVQFRASSLPTMFGEKIVLRVLANDPVLLDLGELGLSPEDLTLVSRHVLQPHGIILATGPTGSGKTTTLYAALMRVSAERQSVVNISTIEDPIEYTIPRINQVPIRHEVGLDFANGLRALLRQDPDVIMVGEIRDRETAEMAVRAALVGRMVLSTLHTNDAASAIPRLLDMGIEPYLLISTLSLVIAQRLVRQVCESCRESSSAAPELILALAQREDWTYVEDGLRARNMLRSDGHGLDGLQFFRGRGCSRCHGTGYRGRVALFEVLSVGAKARRMAATHSDARAIRQASLEDGLRPMLVDGISKALLGVTTLEEVLRATG